MARPAFEITDEVIKKAEEKAARGLTKEQIAECLGISYVTLNEKTKMFPEFLAAIKRGQAKGINDVANALFNSATIDMNTTAQLFYLKCRAAWRDQDPQDKTDNHEIKEAIKSMKELAEKCLKNT